MLLLVSETGNIETMTDEEYKFNYRRLSRNLGEHFAIGNSSCEQLLQAVNVIEHEMNDNGGCNWVESDYTEYLDTLRDNLTSSKVFTSEQLTKIHWAIDEIIMCGREIEQRGISSRLATQAVEYLIQRVVDLCNSNKNNQ